MKTEAQAITEIKIKAQAENEPSLSDTEVLYCLSRYARASVWLAETVYGVGVRVVPSTANGRIYRCIQGGTSGTAAPTSWDYTTLAGTCLNDGTAIWMDDGAAPVELWDISAATGEAWRLKASKDSALIDISDKDTKIMITARRDFANRQAARHVGTWVA